MDKNKLIPVVILGILLLTLLIILFVDNKNKGSYKELVINTNNEDTVRGNLKVNDLIVVNNISFWVVSKSKSGLILHASEKFKLNNKNTDEIQLKINNNYQICFENNTCSLFYLQ